MEAEKKSAGKNMKNYQKKFLSITDFFGNFMPIEATPPKKYFIQCFLTLQAFKNQTAFR